MELMLSISMLSLGMKCLQECYKRYCLQYYEKTDMKIERFPFSTTNYGKHINKYITHMYVLYTIVRDQDCLLCKTFLFDEIKLCI